MTMPKVCPRCKRLEEQKREAGSTSWDSLRTNYGVVTFASFVARIHPLIQPRLCETLVEECRGQVGSDGLVRVKYWCFCNRCGLECTHEFERQLSLAEETNLGE